MTVISRHHFGTTFVQDGVIHCTPTLGLWRRLCAMVRLA